MADPISFVVYTSTIVAITSMLQKRHKDNEAELKLLVEGHQIAQEIERMAMELPDDPDTKPQDDIVQWGSTIREIRESFSSAKTREDLQDSAQRLQASRDKLLSMLGKDQEGSKSAEATDFDQPSLSQRIWVRAEGSLEQISAVALLDTGSNKNIVSERFLESVGETVSWSGAFSRLLNPLQGFPVNSSYRWLRGTQAWIAGGTVKLNVSLSASPSQTHRLSFVIHHGASFFGDMLLGRDFLRLSRLDSQPSTHQSRGQGLTRIHDHREPTTANIIFVHSLYGDASDTWRGRSRTFWPKDFLAKDLEKYAVWTYGYDINQTRSKSAKSFEDLMDSLANDLLEQIDQHTSKPILWICHSLGGHLVKSALTRSRARLNQTSNRVSRLSKTKGVIFMGTPHGANTSIAVFEDIMAVSRGSRGAFGKQKKVESHKFDNSIAYTAAAFASLMDRECFPIISLFENKPMLTRRGPRTIVLPFTRMHHPEESWDYLEGDHLSICRFETREEKGYQKILTSVKGLLEGKSYADTWNDVEMDVQSRNHSKRTSVSDMELVDIDKIYLNLRLKIDLPTMRWQSPKSVDDFDSTWIRKDPLVEMWLDGDRNKERRPLLVRGPIGCGKSKIAESMQEWLDVPQWRALSPDSRNTTCHLQLFFKSDQRTQQTPTTMLEYLIAQTLDQNAALVYHIRRKPFSRGLPLSLTHALLQGTLRIMLEDTCWSSIYLVVDALDECNPKYANVILETLSFILGITNVMSLLTISTVTSGPELEAGEARGTPIDSFIANQQCITLDLHRNNAWKEVLTQYVEGRLMHLRRETGLATESSDRVKETLLRLPNLSFAVTDLGLQYLRNVLSEESSQRKHLFEAQLERLKDRARIDSLLIDLASTRPAPGHWVLSVLACAFEPLRLQELAVIFARDRETERGGIAGDHARTTVELQSLVDDDLRHLVRVDGDGLHLVSRSVRWVINDRMARSETINRDASKTESGWCDARNLHLRLSKICLQMLLDRVDPDKKRAPLPADGYAQRHWENHLREAGPLADDINGLVVQWIKAQKELQHDSDKVKSPSDPSPILLKRLTDNNLFDTLGSVFDDPNLGLRRPDPEDIDRVLEHSITTSTPETLQVLRGMSRLVGDNDDTVKTFLAMAAGDKNELAQLLGRLDLSGKTKYLHKAIEMQEIDIVQTILDSYSDDHIPEKLDEIAYAVQFQSHQIVQRMLIRKELFNLDTGLLAAVDVANLRMCEDLLAHGAKVCLVAATPPAPTPLHIAAQRGRRDLVDLMLKWNAPVNIRDSRAQTPLHHAAKSGRVDIIRRLIAGSASVAATDSRGWTALFSACAFGQAEAARLLWSAGGSISHRDNDGRSMLHSAAKYGHTEVVTMLISAGISAQCTDNVGITPIHESCQSGWAPIVDELLQTGASINGADNNGRTCLHYACECRSVPESVVQLLLDMGADASARDRDDCTPLMLAAQFSTVRVLKIFWTHDVRLFRDADNKGRRLLDYLDLPGDTKTAGRYEEKKDFLGRYYTKSRQPSGNIMVL